jgi:hypothetical protein
MATTPNILEILERRYLFQITKLHIHTYIIHKQMECCECSTHDINFPLIISWVKVIWSFSGIDTLHR